MKQRILCALFLLLSVLNRASSQTITTGAVPATACAGSQITIPFTVSAPFAAGNVFTVQLSNSIGSFVAPINNIGFNAGTNSGSISVFIPLDIQSSNFYRVRVVASSPAVNGSNSTNIAITTNVFPSVTIARNTTSGLVCINTLVTFTATPVNGGAAPSYQWKKNGVNVGLNSASYTNAAWANGDYVECVMTSNATCPYPGTVWSNRIYVPVDNLTADTWLQKNDVGNTEPNKGGPSPRMEAAGFVIGNKGYIGTGTGNSNNYVDFWEFDPTSGVWTQRANFGGVARSGAVGFSIGNRGYIGTGTDGTNQLNDFWEYNPTTNTWTQRANFGGVARRGAVGFGIGNRGYIGTGTTGVANLSDFWEYNPANNTWLSRANFSGVSRYEAVGFSIGSKGYIGTGFDGTNRLKDFWEYNPASNVWTARTAFGGSARNNATGFSVGSKGYIGTGFDGTNRLSDFWEYDPATNAWTARANFGGGPRESALGFGIGTKGYLGTGRTEFGIGVNDIIDFWEYDPAINTWTSREHVNSKPREEAVGFSIGNKGYVGLGFHNGVYLNDFWEYNPMINVWTQRANFGGVARRNAVGFSIVNKGYVGTGMGANPSVTYFDDFWEYNPATNAWIQRANFPGLGRTGAVGFSIGNKGYVGTGMMITGVRMNDFWEYNPGTNLWIQRANYPARRQNAVGFSIGEKGYIGSGENGTIFQDFYEYDTSTNAWTFRSNIPGTGRDNAVGFSIGNKGYIGLGSIFGNYNSDFLEFDPVANTWTAKANFGGGLRDMAVGFSIGDKAYIGTGRFGVNRFADFWEFTPNNTRLFTGSVPAQLCPGSTFNLPYTIGCNAFGAGNTFTVQLSDTLGSFSNPLIIGSLSSTTSGTISATIPPFYFPGTRYRVRVVGSNPSTIGVDNGSNVEILSFTNSSVTIQSNIATENICSNQSVTFTASVTNGGAAPVYQWFKNGLAVGLNSSTYTNNAWLLGDSVECVVNSSAACPLPAVVRSNRIFVHLENPNPNSWQTIPGLGFSSPNSKTQRNGAFSLAIGNKGYVGGGYRANSTTPLRDFWEYDPVTDLWTQRAVFPSSSSAQAASFSIGSKGYVGAGTADAFSTSSEFYEYDPATNVWTAKANLPIPKRVAVGFSIHNFGYIGLGGSASFYAYDPVLNTWTAKANFPGASTNCYGFASGNKGYANAAGTTEIWQYDPLLNTWSLFSNHPGAARAGATAFALGNNFYIGFGTTGAAVYTTDFHRYNVSTNTWSTFSTLSNFTRTNASALVINGVAYVGFGTVAQTQGINYVSPSNDWYQLNAATNIFTAKATLGAEVLSSLVSFSIGNKGYLGTGFGTNAGFMKNEWWAFDPATNRWQRKNNIPITQRTGATGFSIGNRGYIGTGSQATNTAAKLNDWWSYDPISDAWTQSASLPSAARGDAVGFSIGSKGYVGTGFSNIRLNDFWEYNPIDNSWVQKANFPGVERRDAFGFVVNNLGYLGGGSASAGVVNDFYSYDPQLNTWTSRAAFPGANLLDCMSFSLDSSGFVSCKNTAGSANDLWEYQTGSDTWISGPSVPSPAGSSGAGFSVNGKGYLTMGQNNPSVPNYNAYEYTKSGKKIQTGSVAGPICAGTSLVVPYTIGCSPFNAGNQFIAQLSDSTGSFAQPVNIGTLVSTSAGSISAFIPGDISIGAKYRIRVIGTNPLHYGSNNGVDLVIRGIVNTRVVISTVSNTGLVCQNENLTFTATPTNGGATPQYLWKKNGVNVGANSPVYSNASWLNGDVIECVMTSNAACPSPSITWSNRISISVDNNNPDSWQQKADMSFTQSNGPVQRSGAAGFSIGGKTFMGTGSSTTTLNDFWEYDPVTNTWTQRANFGGAARSNAVGFSIGNKGYIGTGVSGLTRFNDFWEYDPATNAWTQKANFGGTTRELAVGFCISNKGYIGTGTDGTNKNDFWEYDPASNTWTPKANFAGTARQAAIGFNIGNKGYIGTGNDGIRRNDFWEYDPATNTWTQKADMGGPARQSGAGFSIGLKGFIGTGFDGVNRLNDFWEYDSRTNTWTQKTNLQGLARQSAVGVSNGSNGYIGTGTINGARLNDLWKYDTALNNWVQVADFGGLYRESAVGFNIGRMGYVSTGNANGIAKNDFWAYDPFTNSWSQKANFGGTARYGAVGFNIGNKGYIGTGIDGISRNDFWEYDPSTNVWTQKANFGGVARSSAVGFSIGNKGYLGTGMDQSGVRLNDFWEYDPSTNVWTQKANFGGTARRNAVGISIGNKGYIGTGFTGVIVNDFWEYDPSTNTWTQKANFGGTARSGATGFSIGDKGYIGTGADGVRRNDFWEYNPSTNSWTQRANAGVNARTSAAGFSIGNKGYIATGSTNNFINDFWEYSPTNTRINIGSVNPPGPYCPGATLTMQYSVGCNSFNGGNVFTAQLSDSVGSFANPVPIGSSTEPFFGLMSMVIPQNTLPGTRYRIRVVGSNPNTISTSNETDLVINGPTPTAVSIARTDGTGVSCENQSLTYEATPVNGGSSPVYQWRVNGVDLPFSNVSTLNRSFNAGDYLECTMTSNAACASPSVAWSNRLYVPVETGISDAWNRRADVGASQQQSISPRASATTMTIGERIYLMTGEPGLTPPFNTPALNDVWEFNPMNGSWSQRSDFPGSPRAKAAAFSIGSKGYLGTGIVNNSILNDFWEFDPATNIWMQRANFPGGGCYGAVGFSIGSIGFIGSGLNASLVATQSFYRYNPGYDTWEFASDMGGPARTEAFAFTIGNRAYVGGGGINTTTTGLLNDFWEFNPITNTWTAKASFTGIERKQGAGFSVGVKGYVATGLGASNAKNDLWEYNPSSNTWTQKANFSGTARSGAVAFSYNNTAYLGTGYTGAGGNYKSDFWRYNPLLNTWTRELGLSSNVRKKAVGFSIGTKGYIGTGMDDVRLKDFWEYDPDNDAWTQKADFGGTARFGAVGFSIGNKGYIGTGDDGSLRKDFWEYNPVSNTWLQKASFGGTSRKEATGFSIGNRGYLGAGDDGIPVLIDFWEYNPTTNVWVQKADLGSSGIDLTNSASFSLGSKGYVYNRNIGMFQYDPTTNEWKGCNSGPISLQDASAFSIGRRGYVVLGTTNFGSTYSTDVWEFNPEVNAPNSNFIGSWTLQPNTFPGKPRTHAVAFSIGSKGFVGTGANFDDEWSVVDFWEYSPSPYKIKTGAVAAGPYCPGQSITVPFSDNCNNVPFNAIYQLHLSDSVGSFSNAVIIGETASSTNPVAVTGIIPAGTTPGNRYRVRVVILDPYVVGSDNGQDLVVSPVSLPRVSISTDGNIGLTCQSTSITFTASVADVGSNPVYQWKKNGLNVGVNSNTYTETAWTNGNFVECFVTTGAGCFLPTTVLSNQLFITRDNQNANSWRRKADVGAATQSGQGPPARSGAVSFVIGNNAYICTGDYRNDLWEYNQMSDVWTQRANLPGSGRSYAASFSIGDKGYVGTGENSFGQRLGDFWQYNPVLNNWTQKDFLPVNCHRAVGFSIGSKGYVGMGSNLQRDLWEYDAILDLWQEKASLPFDIFNGSTEPYPTGFSIGSKGYVYKSVYQVAEYDPIADAWTNKSIDGQPTFIGTLEATSFVLGDKAYILTTDSIFLPTPGYENQFWSFQPSTNTWTQRAAFPGTARSHATGFAVNGKGYVGTGIAAGSVTLADCWEYDPQLNTWTQKRAIGAELFQKPVSFSIYGKGYVGIGSANGLLNNNFWEYDPSVNVWTQKANFAGQPRSNAVGFSIGDKGYVGTGENSFGTRLVDFWQYDPQLNSWIQKANVPGAARSGAIGFSIGSKGYIGTGFNEFSGLLSDFWEYNPSSNTWTQKANFAGSAREDAYGFSIGNKGYVGAGYNGFLLNDLWEYDPITNQWVQKANLPGANRSSAVGFSIGTKGYVGSGGHPLFNLYLNDFWEYEPATNTWLQRADIGGGSRIHAIGFSIGNKGYIGSGNDAQGAMLGDFWEYSPSNTRITTGDVNPGTFCPGVNITIPFTLGCGAFGGGNVFTAEISDSIGSFSNPIAMSTVSSSANQLVVTIPALPNASSQYRVRIVGSNPATIGIPSLPINIIRANSVTLTSAVGTNAQTRCINTAITNITYITTGATGATVTGLPAGVTGAFAANTVTISGTPTASGTFNYTVTLTGGCGTIMANGSITVTANNSIALSSAVGTNAQTPCINTAITNITYTTTGATGATVTGLPAGVTGAFAANTVTISGTPTVSGTFNYTVTLTGGCGTITANGSITVTANNTITLSSAVGTNAQTRCINTAITNITYTTTGATGATVTGLPAGITGSFASNTVTISGTPTVSGTFNYTVTLTGGCGTIIANGTITVTANNTIALSSAVGTDAQTKCINTAITNITYTTTGATGANVTGLPSGVTGSFASNTVTISGTPTTSGSFIYTVTLIGGCGSVTASGFIISQNNNIITRTSPVGTVAQIRCINSAIDSVTYSTIGATGAIFSGLPPGVSGSFASNKVTISGTPTVAGIYNYTVTLTGGCGNTTAVGSITVNGINTIELVSAAGTDAQIQCIEMPLTNIVYATTGATSVTITGLPFGVTYGLVNDTVTIMSGQLPTYPAGVYNYTITLLGGCGTVSTTGQFTIRTTNATLTSGTGTDSQIVCVNTPITTITYSIEDADSVFFTGLPPGVTGSFDGSVITINGTPTTSGVFPYSIIQTGSCASVVLRGSIDVRSNISIILSSPGGSDSQTRCINNSILDIVYSTSSAITGATVSGLPAGVTSSLASHTVTISGTPTASGTFNYTVTLTGGCGTTTANGTITVTANKTITLSSAAGTNAQTGCINTAITNITYATTGASGATVTGLPPGVTRSFASNTVTISGTPIASGTFNYTVTLTGGCGTITANGSIAVTANNTITLSSAVGTNAQTRCINTAITNITYTTTGATGATVTGLPAGVTGSFATNTVTISGTPTASGTFNYTVTLTGGCGTITANGSLNVIANSSITSQPTSTIQSFCQNSTADALVVTSAGTNLNYQWFINSLPSNTGGTAIVSATSASLIPLSTTPGTFYYYVVITGACGSSVVSAVSGPQEVKPTGTWLGVNNNWHQVSNWCGGIPTQSTNCIIPSASLNSPVINSSMAFVNNLDIQSGSSVKITGQTLKISGNFSGLGKLQTDSGTLELNGTVAQTLSGNRLLNNKVGTLIISNNQGVTLTGTNDTLKIRNLLRFGNSNCKLTTNGNLTILSDSLGTASVGDMTSDGANTGIYSGNLILGNVTVERFIPNHIKAWQFLGIPTIGQTIRQSWMENNLPLGNVSPGFGGLITSNLGGNNAGSQALGFDLYSANGPGMKYYNPVTNNWIGVSSANDPINNTLGYMVFIRGDRSVTAFNQQATATTLRTTGQLKTPLTNPPAIINVPINSFASVGNPYASAIDFSKVNRTGGVQDLFYVWDPLLSPGSGFGAYQTFLRSGAGYLVVPGGGSYAGGNTQIESGAAFFVRANNTSNGTLTFSESSKVNGSNIVTRQPVEHKARLFLRLHSGLNDALLDGVASEMDSIHSHMVDAFDALKVGISSGEQISLLKNSVSLSVERMPFPQLGDTIHYHMRQLRRQEYYLKWIPEEMTNLTIQPILVDRYMSVEQPLFLDDTTLYSFTVNTDTSSSSANRFYVIFRPLIPVPVLITDIHALRVNMDNVIISWDVQPEEGVMNYVLERSYDGRIFSQIETKTPVRNDGTQAHYQSIDAQAPETVCFYRVKVQSFNGEVIYTRTISVDAVKRNMQFLINPNPIQNNRVRILMCNVRSGVYLLRLLDNSGKQVKSRKLKLFEGDQLFEWDVTKLPSGGYLLQIIALDGGIFNSKVIVP